MPQKDTPQRAVGTFVSVSVRTNLSDYKLGHLNHTSNGMVKSHSK